MTEEDRIFAGKLFNPGDDSLRAIKLRTHNLCTEYNQTFEDESKKRTKLIQNIFAFVGEESFFQGPIYIHYGTHTEIGERFFGNFNLTIQDDAKVIIGNDCNFGPNVTIVTPMHPLVAEERLGIDLPESPGRKRCYAKPVTIGNNCWFGANVTVCPGVTIGDNVVLGAGSVVTKDIPANTVAAGVPAKVMKEITEADSLLLRPDLL